MNLSSIEEKVTQDSLLLDPVLQGHGQKDQW